MNYRGFARAPRISYVAIAAILQVALSAVVMPETCSVKDCHNRGTDDRKVSYHRFPAIILDEGEKTRELSTRRWLAWIASLRRKNWEPTRYLRVCSDHFISGSQLKLVCVAK